MGKENSDYYYFGAVDGNLDYYFIYGPSVKEVVEGLYSPNWKNSTSSALDSWISTM